MPNMTVKLVLVVLATIVLLSSVCSGYRNSPTRRRVYVPYILQRFSKNAWNYRAHKTKVLPTQTASQESAKTVESLSSENVSVSTKMSKSALNVTKRNKLLVLSGGSGLNLTMTSQKNMITSETPVIKHWKEVPSTTISPSFVNDTPFRKVVVTLPNPPSSIPSHNSSIEVQAETSTKSIKSDNVDANVTKNGIEKSSVNNIVENNANFSRNVVDRIATISITGKKNEDSTIVSNNLINKAFAFASGNNESRFQINVTDSESDLPINILTNHTSKNDKKDSKVSTVSNGRKRGKQPRHRKTMMSDWFRWIGNHNRNLNTARPTAMIIRTAPPPETTTPIPIYQVTRAYSEQVLHFLGYNQNIYPNRLRRKQDCLGKSDRGTCTDYVVKWYYDAESQKCMRFWYGGCPGKNNNRFDNEELCQRECMNVKPTTDPTAVDLETDNNNRNETSREGAVVVLVCHAGQTLDDQKVIWTGKDGNSVISVGYNIIAIDPRYEIDYNASNHNWYLKIKNVSVKDSGMYSCYLGESLISKVTLDVQEARELSSLGDCRSSDFGCCQDGTTPAKGPNEEGCSTPVVGSCHSTPYGCCADGVTSARGDNKLGCPETEILIGGCAGTRYGCCADGVTSARGDNKLGCPETEILIGGCAGTRYGCCADGVTSARGDNKLGCPETEILIGGCAGTRYGCCADGVTSARGDNKLGCPETEILIGGCAGTRYGCCADGVTSARGDSKLGCPETEILIGGCAGTRYGCCADGVTSARGDNKLGCPETEILLGGCASTRYGCCADGVTSARGDNKLGCPETEILIGGCAGTRYGCCADGVTSARGDNKLGCPETEILIGGCAGTRYGCCADGVTSARGDNKLGCPETEILIGGCAGTRYGCCADGVTSARGDNKLGCPETEILIGGCAGTRYGCCADGVTSARGDNKLGCPETEILLGGCASTRYGCCADRVTSARGPSREGCPETRRCSSSRYGCCADGVREATGPNRDGCPETRPSLGGTQSTCNLGTSRGPCTDYVVRWYYNSTQGRCDRFWYGGCEGNGNNFEDEPSCKQSCAGAPDTQPTAEPQEVVKSGTCPDVIPEVDSAGRCVNECYNDYDCAGLQKCCSRGCSRTCQVAKEGTPTSEYKNGQCPAVPLSTSPDCSRTCDTDFQCPGAQKCCYNGCGYKCSDPWSGSAREEETASGSDVCSLGSERGSCANYVVRWFYNKEREMCDRFWYGGCDSNGNNFMDEEECKRKCVTPVTNTDVCKLPSAVGPCRASKPRFFYNAQTGKCESFIYGGCRGNENRFMTRADCERRCGGTSGPSQQCGQYGCCPDGVTPAQGLNNLGCPISCRDSQYGCCDDGETRAEGPNGLGCEDVDGSGDVDPELLCSQFVHGCCDDGVTPASGPNKEGCPRATPEPSVRPDVDVNFCNKPYERGPCDNYTVRWYFDSRQSRCDRFWYGGCQGNKNNFKNEAECQQACVKQEPEIPSLSACEQPKDPGMCPESTRQSYQRRYYFDQRSRLCVAFAFSGCGGNQNNFADSTSCQKQCGDDRDINIDETTPSPGEKEEGGLVCSYKEHKNQEPKFDQNVSLMASSTNTVEECQEACTETASCTGISFELPSGSCVIYQNRNWTLEYKEKSDFYEKNCTGDVCLLPQKVGVCRGSFPRWYFDKQNQECRQFIYGGCQGNENNFESLEACKQRCDSSRTDKETNNEDQDICTMKSEVGPCRAAVSRWHYDHSDGTCKTFTYGGCLGNPNNFVTKAECESRCSREHVCRVTKEPLIQCLAYIRRYRFDPSTGDCAEFIYGGCGGSSNNFESLAACRNKCVEQPSTNQNRTLTQEEICALPASSGPCFAYFEKYFFNSNTRECERFVYGGCAGNPNRFDDLEQCQQACGESGNVIVVPEEQSGDGEEVTSDFCHLSKEAGPCFANVSAWYYDHLNGECKTFTFGGCLGNNNRFTSQEICEESCSRNTVCDQRPDPGNCLSFTTRYYYDVSDGQCKGFQYGGCNGNANNFVSLQSCQRKCGVQVPVEKPGECPTVPANQVGTCEEVCSSDSSCGGDQKCCSNGCGHVCTSPRDTNIVSTSRDCMLPVARGSCSDMVIMFYYDDTISDCRPFRYSGCDGNNNRFSSGEECREVCVYPNRNQVTPRPRPTPAPVTSTPAPTTTKSTDVVVPGTFDVCDEDKEVGPCTDWAVKWFFDYSRQRCDRFWYGGCEGNGNRFEDEAECKTICIDRRRPVTPRPLTPRPFTPRPTYFPTLVPQPEAPCMRTRFGCCPDGIMAAADKYFSNCREPDNGDNEIPIGGEYTTVVQKRGENVKLLCEDYRNAEGRGSVLWYKGGYRVIMNNRFRLNSDGSLEISALTKEDGGLYSCQIKNGNTLPYYERTKLIIEEPIGIFPTPSKIVVRPYGNAFLHCQAFGSPVPRVTWSKGSSPISTGGKMQVFNNGTLIIKGVEPNDIGDYICTAENGVSSPAERIIMLSLRESLRVSIDPVQSQVREGGSFSLRCRGFGYPTPSIQWEKMGRPLKSDSRIETVEGYLRISASTMEDTGFYTCIVSNDEEKVESSVSIEILAKDTPLPDCKDRASKMQCRLIVTANLCGYSLYSGRCCESCERDRRLG